MNHLGEIGFACFMLSGYIGAMSMGDECISLVDGHPGTKRLEPFKLRSLLYSRMPYGLCLE
jgi:hypothetical protein